MRDRLIELFLQYCRTYDDSIQGCEESLADYLLAEGVIVPPCKVGTLYMLRIGIGEHT